MSRASAIVAADHVLRGQFWPRSVYGVSVVSPWRWVEHTTWVVFEDIVLAVGCYRSLREQWMLAFQQAKDEVAHSRVEATVEERTALLRDANEALSAEVCERRRVEGALRHSELEARKLALVAAHTQNAVILADANGRIEWVNDAFCRITGYQLDEVIGRSPGSFLQGRKTDVPTAEFMRERIYSGEGFNVEILNYTKSGKPFWVLIEVQPIRDESGRLTRFIGVQTDITSRKSAEWRLTAQHAAMRVLAESVSLDQALPQLLRTVCESLGLDRGEYWQVDPAAGMLDLVHEWSAALEEDREFSALSNAIRFPRGLGLPGRVWALNHPDSIGDVTDDNRFLRSAAAAHAGLRAAVGFPITSAAETIGVMVFLSRSELEMDLSLDELLTTLGRQIGMFIERRRAEDEARERQRFIERLTDANPSMIYLFDMSSGRTTFVNDRVSVMFGFRPDQLNGQEAQALVASLVHPDDATRLGFHDPRGRFREIADGQVLESEFRSRHADGSWRWVRCREVVFRRDLALQPVEILGTIEDITQRKTAEEKFQVLFERSSDAHLLFDERDGVIDCNQAALQLFGCKDRSELRGLHPAVAVGGIPTRRTAVDGEVHRDGFNRAPRWISSLRLVGPADG